MSKVWCTVTVKRLQQRFQQLLWVLLSESAAYSQCHIHSGVDRALRGCVFVCVLSGPARKNDYRWTIDSDMALSADGSKACQCAAGAVAPVALALAVWSCRRVEVVHIASRDTSQHNRQRFFRSASSSSPRMFRAEQRPQCACVSPSSPRLSVRKSSRRPLSCYKICSLTLTTLPLVSSHLFQPVGSVDPGFRLCLCRGALRLFPGDCSRARGPARVRTNAGASASAENNESRARNASALRRGGGNCNQPAFVCGQVQAYWFCTFARVFLSPSRYLLYKLVFPKRFSSTAPWPHVKSSWYSSPTSASRTLKALPGNAPKKPCFARERRIPCDLSLSPGGRYSTHGYLLCFVIVS